MTELRCPHCGNKGSTVLQTRSKPDRIRRERLCVQCQKSFWTREEATCDAPPGVVAQDNDVLPVLELDVERSE